MPYGYNTPNGYFGLIDGEFILFATEEEYYDIFMERKNNEQI